MNDKSYAEQCNKNAVRCQRRPVFENTLVNAAGFWSTHVEGRHLDSSRWVVLCWLPFVLIFSETRQSVCSCAEKLESQKMAVHYQVFKSHAEP